MTLLRDSIVDAARENELVLLVGAGASKADDALVPLFGEILKECPGYEEAEARTSNCGRMVDLMEAMYPGTKRRIVEEVDRAEQKAKGESKVHAEIAELWRSGRTELILTTNWDTLIEKSANNRAAFGIQEWKERGEDGGRRAKGVCHLHGRIGENTQIVSAHDMEEHYGKDEEAAFLREVVLRRPVLAIGYSMEDEMVRRICREAKGESRGGELKLWVFAESTDGSEYDKRKQAEDLKEIGAELITFERGKFDEVPKELRKLREASMENRRTEMENLKATGRSGPDAVSCWASLAETIQKNALKASALLEEADYEQWCNDKRFQEAIRRVFGQMPIEEGEEVICQWLAKEVDLKRLKHLWKLSADAGGGWHPRLRHALAFSARESAEREDIETNEAVVETILQSCARDGFWDTDIIGLKELTAALGSKNKTGAVCRIFGELTRVTSKPATEFAFSETDGGSETGSIKPCLQAQSWWTYEYWKDEVKDLVPLYAHEIANIVVGELQRYEGIRRALAGDGEAWDSWSYRRSGIEANDQDEEKHHRPENSLIEAGREVIEHLGTTEGSEEAWSQEIDRLERCGGQLGRRLATHGVRTSQHWTGSKKLEWISEGDRITEVWRHHETYLLVKDSWDEASPESRDRVVQKISRIEIAGAEEVWNKRRRFDFLSWLAKSGRRTEYMNEELTRLRQEYPQWALRDHAEWLHYSSGAQWIGDNEPAELADATSRWSGHQEEVMDAILGWEPGPRTTENFATEANEGGAVKSVEKLLREADGATQALASKLKQRQLHRHWAWKGILKVIGENPVGENLQVAEELPGETRSCDALRWHAGEYLQSLAKGQTGTDEEKARARCIAWNQSKGALARDDDDGEPRDDWIMEMLNTGTGKCVSVAMTLLGEWSDGKEINEHRNKVDEILEYLESAVARGKQTGYCVIASCGEKFAWLRWSHEGWVTNVVVARVLEGTDAEVGNAFWDGLRYAAWHHVEVIEALEEVLKKTVEGRMETEDGRRTRIATEKYAYVLLGMTCQGRAEYKDWAIGHIEGRIREKIVEEVGSEIARLDEVPNGVWDRSLNPLWVDLLGPIGENVRENEQKALLGCISKLTATQQQAAVRLIREGPAVPPEGLWGIGKNETLDREAALEILQHCLGSLERTDLSQRWPWGIALEKTRDWNVNDLSAAGQERLLELRAAFNQ